MTFTQMSYRINLFVVIASRMEVKGKTSMTSRLARRNNPSGMRLA